MSDHAQFSHLPVIAVFTLKRLRYRIQFYARPSSEMLERSVLDAQFIWIVIITASLVHEGGRAEGSALEYYDRPLKQDC